MPYARVQRFSRRTTQPRNRNRRTRTGPIRRANRVRRPTVSRTRTRR